MNANSRSEMVGRFLAGGLSGEEIEMFRELLEKDAFLRQELEEEAGIEALSHLAFARDETQHNYDHLIDKAIHQGKKQGSTSTAFWINVYAVAATITLLALGVHAISIALSKNTRLRASENASDYVSVPRDGKSLTWLSPNAVLLTEPGTRAHLKDGEESRKQVVIAQGNAFFDIPELRGAPVSVITPHTAITINNTVVRIVVTELETEISVFEGDVEVVHRDDRDRILHLATGGTGFADHRTLQMTNSLDSEMCQRRVSLFRTYVGWVKNQMKG